MTDIARKLAALHSNIAADVYPNGAVLTCTRCKHAERATSEDCARYLSRGWPKHCGATMAAGQPAAELPLGDAPKGRKKDALHEGH